MNNINGTDESYLDYITLAKSKTVKHLLKTICYDADIYIWFYWWRYPERQVVEPIGKRILILSESKKWETSGQIQFEWRWKIIFALEFVDKEKSIFDIKLSHIKDESSALKEIKKVARDLNRILNIELPEIKVESR